MITFVALLMFLQLGIGWEWSTLLCGLLSLPWVLKSFVREKVRRMGGFAIVLRIVRSACFLIHYFNEMAHHAGFYGAIGAVFLLRLA